MKYSTDPVPTDDDHVPKGSDGRQPYSLGSLTWDKSWTYRRSLSAQPGNPSVASPGDSSNQNFNNDYSGGFLFTSPTLTLAAETSWTGGINKTVLAAAEQRSYGYYHYIKNLGSPNASPYLYMPLDEQTGTGHGLAKTPYLRESRRAKRGLDGFRLLYEHLNASNAQDDIHSLQSCSYPAYITASNHPVKPYYIPFRALTTSEVDNLLVSGKSMAQSFLANAATRLHPTEWSSGCAAGAAAALMVQRGWSSTRQVLDKVSDLQALLESDLVRSPLTWTL